jgi:hypothetical protein
MDEEKVENNIFSAEHPVDLLERILAEGATQTSFKDVYRISDDGLCHRDTFLCSALMNSQREMNNRDAYLAQLQQEYDVEDWSTSCWADLEKAKKILALKEKFNDSPALLKGSIVEDTGYSILTTERNSIKVLPSKQRNKRKHHIDWWIFEEKDVSAFFSKLEV